MKKIIILYLVTAIFLLSGCSAKNGAIIGGTTGAIVGGLLGAGLSKQHVGNGKTTQTAIEVGLVFGLIGSLLGGSIGYISDKNIDNEKEINTIIKSNHMIQEI